jgi:glutathione S-transferase
MLPQSRPRGVAKPELALYGHPFSSYTWKALIALYANDTPFEFRIVDHPEHCEVVATASPQGKFPLLADGDTLIFEATSIIEYLDMHHPGQQQLIPKKRPRCACLIGCSTIT